MLAFVLAVWVALLPVLYEQTQLVQTTTPEDRVHFGLCNGFPIDKHLYVSANHCWHEGAEFTIGDKVATVVYWDESSDLLLLEVEQKVKPLRLSRHPVALGEEVAVVGYTVTVDEKGILPFAVFARMVSYNVPIKPDEWPKGNDIISSKGIPGMSGAAVVNSEGEVVGVYVGGGPPTSMYEHVGITVPLKQLKEFLASYRESVARRQVPLR